MTWNFTITLYIYNLQKIGTIKITIKTVEQVINPRSENPILEVNLINSIKNTTEVLMQSNNYSYKFKKSEHHYSNANWREIARDIAVKINK